MKVPQQLQCWIAQRIQNLKTALSTVNLTAHHMCYNCPSLICLEIICSGKFHRICTSLNLEINVKNHL